VQEQHGFHENRRRENRWLPLVAERPTNYPLNRIQRCGKATEQAMTLLRRKCAGIEARWTKLFAETAIRESHNRDDHELATLELSW
jgi:hypothetical protein